MWYHLLGVVFLAASAFAVDPTIYKNCSEQALCSEKRGLERQNRYNVIVQGAAFAQGIASFPMTGPDGTNLTLTISSYIFNQFRIEIEEVKSRRYHIENVLDPDSDLRNSYFTDVQLWLDKAILVMGDTKVTVNFSPFSLEFYYDEVLQQVFEGDRLTLEQNDLSTPFTFAVSFAQASILYGLHEHADHVALRTTEPGGYDPYRVRTMDLTNYELYSTMAMYGAIPALFGHGVNATTGVFLHNAAELWVEITNDGDNGPNAYFIADSGALDLFVMLGPRNEDVIRQYTLLTGVAHLPPIWSLGYHQCRWGYADQQDVQTVIADLDHNDFPVDAIWLDIQHTDNMKFFTWNTGNFSDPFAMLSNLSSTHRYLITLSDPHFKKEEGYFVYDEGIARDFFIKNPNGTTFEDQCWPGTSVWMDYLNPEARDYYSSLYLYENWNGTTPTLGGIWNDMNEAAIFNEPNEKTFPYDVLHYGGVPNRDIHNMYGFLQTMATHKGLTQRDNGTIRPFILTRAHFAGSQRYAAFWTGDNTADWGFIPISYSMCLTANLLGISFCGADIGGFFDEPPEELLSRWYLAAAWLPFFREHSNIGSERREPYLYPDNVQKIIKTAIKTRYAHLPVWYTLFFEHTRSGSPVIRPLFYHYPNDTQVFGIDEQLLVGENILVKAVAEPGAQSAQVYFPGGEDVVWFSQSLDGTFYRGTGFANVSITNETIPVFYRHGSIIPVKLTPRPSTTDMLHDPYSLYVFLNRSHLASCTIYNDDTSSFQYRDGNRYNYLNVTAHTLNSDYISLSFEPMDASDSTNFDIAVDTVVVLSVEDNPDGTLKYVKSVYNTTEDGTPLSSIRIGGKNSMSLKLR